MFKSSIMVNRSYKDLTALLLRDNSLFLNIPHFKIGLNETSGSVLF